MPFHFHWDDFSDAFSENFLKYETEKGAVSLIRVQLLLIYR